MAQQKAESQVLSLKKELQVLSTECRKAFAAAGLEDSTHPQIRRALELCSSHVHDTGAEHLKPAISAIGSLWKSDGHDEQETSVDKRRLATSILGTDLVQKLVEENREPPDVSICFLHSAVYSIKFPARCV